MSGYTYPIMNINKEGVTKVLQKNERRKVSVSRFVICLGVFRDKYHNMPV